MELRHKVNLWGQISCWAGKHLVSDEDLQELIDSPTGKYDTECERCHRKIRLEIDRENEGEYLIKEPEN